MERKPTVLVIDDNPTNLSVLFEYLEEAGIEIAVARSGERALQQLEHQHPDLILLDVMMPGIDGFETCRRLKANETTRQIPVIFMTSLTDAVHKMKGFLAGGNDYVIKPLQYEEVVTRIGAQLRICQLERQLHEQQQAQHDAQHWLKEQTQAFADQQAEFRRQQALYQRLLACISYDLQYPFNKLIGIIRLIVEHIDEFGKTEIKGQMGKLQVSAEELYATHENLLIWAAYQRGLLEQTPEQVDLYQIVSDNFKRFTSHAERKKITLSSSIQEHTLVFANHHMLDTVLRNLLSNALKYTEAEGQVKISAISFEGTIEVSITDTGIGIPKTRLPHLFEPAPIIRQNESAPQETNGLGLLLCHQLIEQNGGTLWCISEIGKGTTMTFRLPQIQET